MVPGASSSWGWFLDKKSSFLAVAAVVLLLLAGWLTSQRVAGLEESNRWVAHTHEVLARIAAIDSTLAAAESAHLGYLLTGEELHLEPYHTAAAHIPEELRQLQDLTSDNPAHQSNLDELEPLVARRLASLKDLIDARSRASGTTPSKEQLAQGKRVGDDIRAVLQRMREDEKGLLQQRQEAARVGAQSTALTLVFSPLLALLLFALAILLVNRNVGQRLRMERELRESERRFRGLFDTASDAILVVDEQAHYIDANGAAERLTGYTREELLHLGVPDLTPEPSRNESLPLYRQFTAQGEMSGECQLLRKGGGIVEVEFAANRVGEGRYQSVLRDVTERKRTHAFLSSVVAVQQEVATAELNLQALMNLIADRAQQLTGAGGAAIELVEGDELVYRAATGMVAPHVGLRRNRAASFSGLCVRSDEVLSCDDADNDPRVDREACRRIGLRSMIVVPLHHQRRAVGVLKVCSSEVRAFNEAHREVLQLMAGLLAAALVRSAAFDAERARVVERTAALQETEERFHLFVEGVKDYAIIMLDSQGRVVSWNAGAERLKGYTAEEILGRHFASFYPAEAVQTGKPDRALAAAAARETSEEEGWRVRKDGTRFWASVLLTALRDGAGTLRGFANVTRDITERKALEEQYQQAQKMEAVGHLAAGVAHDFNNLLTIISGFSEMMLTALPAGDPNRGLIQSIYQAGERAALLTRQLLAFSRKQVIEPRVLDLNEVVGNAEKMLRRLIGEDVRLATVLAPNLDRIKADPGQVEQVIINLAVNARDAMPQGGRLTIETSNVELDENYARSHAEVKPGRHVMLAVTDTGSGMTEEVQRHVFEPFFTTKGPGKGTGLGLATVFGIVKQSGGHVWVYSEVGRGTTFKVYFPSVEEVAPARGSEESRPTAPSGTGTVLLVEDDKQVRGMTRFALQSFGYTVLEAQDGEEALRVAQAHSGAIDLLITDVVMPGIGGRRLAEALSRFRPGIKVLYVSGYTDDAVVRHGVLETEVAFLQKPFAMATLATKVRDVLGR
jgi:PAS domain S-box-containing protein